MEGLVMARKSVRFGDRLSMSPGSRGARSLCTAAVWVLAMTLDAGWTPNARGAGIFRDLTARDRSQPIILSEAGEPIPLATASHPTALLSKGTVPAYLAFPLDGGEHLPAGIPTLSTGPQAGQSVVGPMDLTPATQSQLNADLIASRFAIVDTPGQSYAVAFLPRYASALSHAESSAASTSTSAGASTGTTTTTGTTSIASILGLNAPAADWSINGIPASELSQWVKTGSQEVSHLTSLGVEGVAKTLGLKGLKATPTASGLNLEAQYLVPPSAQGSPAPLPVPAPEPAAWLVFGLVLGAAGLRRRVDRRSRWASRE
jgi:hypothetical protein